MPHTRDVLAVFLMVLIAGTLWRLTAYHMIASPNSGVNHVGKAMAFQY